MSKPTVDNSMWSVFRNRWVKLVLTLVGLWLLWHLVNELSNILVPFGLAVLGAYILNPIVKLLEKRLKWKRVWVVLLLVVVLSAIVVGALGFGVFYAIRSVEKMVPAAQKAIATQTTEEGLIGDLKRQLQRAPEAIREEIDEAIKGLPNLARQHAGKVLTLGFGALGTVFGAVFRFMLRSFNFILFFVVMAYVLMDLPKLAVWAEGLLPVRYHDDIVRILKAIDRDVNAFFRGQILVALLLGVIYTGGLYICRVDFWLIIGAVAGVASIVPYFGLAVGIGPALLMAAVPWVGLWKPIGVVIVFVVGQNIEGFYLTPKIVGKNVGLNPVAVILAILVFGQLLGFLGIIFAVPLAAAVKVLLGELLRYYREYQREATEPPVPR